MAMMRHGEFITKMARWKAAGTWENFRKRHADDPQILSLSDETHAAVCRLGKLVNLSSPIAMRNDLVLRFRAEPPNGKLNSNHEQRIVGVALLIKVMKASGLKWFELDGTAYIHWTEKV